MSVPIQSGALQSAVDSIAGSWREKMAQFGSNCPKMTPAKPKNEGANPPRRRGKAKELTPRQLTAIRLLVAGASATKVAKLLRVGRRTIFRWNADPKFKAEVRAQADALVRPKPKPPQAPARNAFLEWALSKECIAQTYPELSRFDPK